MFQMLQRHPVAKESFHVWPPPDVTQFFNLFHCLEIQFFMYAFHILTADGMLWVVNPHGQTVVPFFVGFKHFTEPHLIEIARRIMENVDHSAHIVLVTLIDRQREVDIIAMEAFEHLLVERRFLPNAPAHKHSEAVESHHLTVGAVFKTLPVKASPTFR